MKTREELLKEKEEIEKQLKALELAEYSKKLLFYLIQIRQKVEYLFIIEKNFILKRQRQKVFKL